MTDNAILVADDDRSIRQVLSQALGRLGYEVRATSNATTLWQWVSNGEGRLVITDVIMPDENALDLIPRIQKIRPDLKVIAMSAQNTLLTAVRANERGAFEYLPKPFDLNELVAVVERALTQSAPEKAPQMRSDATEELPLIGRSSAMQDIYRIMARLMTTDLTVLITGESGTGKELVARALHDYGSRKEGPFVAINMAAIPRELIESELFGHERGSFTGAVGRYAGRFEQANGGTLFLDEIGDMPMEAQTRLLRVLQEGEFTTVGGRMPLRANARIVAATHRDLRTLVKQGVFREDLYYRLNVVPIRLPPLRERLEDVPELARHFLSQSNADGMSEKVLDQPAMDRLKRYHWPGNIRELENLMRRLTALYAQDTVGVDAIEKELADSIGSESVSEFGEEEGGLAETVARQLKSYFAAHEGGIPPAGLYDRVLHEIERPLISLTLDATNGNQIKAAAVLGVNRNTLRKKIRILDIPITRKKQRDD
jgi:two-component system nitrogen regulation response regulator GlnG